MAACKLLCDISFALPVRSSAAMENPTSPGTGEVASLSEPERALSRGRSGASLGKMNTIAKMKVAAYQAPLHATRSMETALGLIRDQVERCELEGVEIL